MADEKERLIESMIGRAEKLVAELTGIYSRDLQSQAVSDDALNLTHEVIEKCSNTLDQIMSLTFDREIKPLIAIQPKRGGYFPAALDEASYRSSLGQWNAANLDQIAPALESKLRSLQPFTGSQNSIFFRIRSIANQKHTRLLPQRKKEQRRVSVTSPGGGGVSWGPGVTFGSGVSVMGVPIDPRTQMPVHSQGIDVAVERWVSFHFEDNGDDALEFCKASTEAARRAFEVLLKP